MERLHRRAGNYSAEMDLVTVAPTSGGGDRAAHLRLLLDFGQHAREFISSEVGLRLLELLADEEKLIFQLSASFSPTVAREITRLLRCCVTIQARARDAPPTARPVGIARRALLSRSCAFGAASWHRPS